MSTFGPGPNIVCVLRIFRPKIGIMGMLMFVVMWFMFMGNDAKFKSSDHVVIM